jgi:hypothetical protein
LLGFLANQSNLTKRCREEVSKAQGCVFSLVEPIAPKGGRRVKLLYYSQKLDVEN